MFHTFFALKTFEDNRLTKHLTVPSYTAILCCTLVSFFSSNVNAQNQQSELDDFSLEGLLQVTIDSKTPRNQKDISSTVHVYTREDIEKHGWNSLSDVFQHIPGVDYTFNGSGYFVSARGVPDYTIHGSKTVIMVDGHDMSNSSFNATSFQGFQKHFDIRNAKRIEILVGPGSTLHGANAYGLVVNIISRDIEDLNTADVILSYGSNEEIIPSISIAKRWGKWGGYFSGTYWKQNKDNLAEVPMRITDGSTIIYDNDLYDDNTVDNYTIHGYVDYENLVRAGYILTKENNGFGTSFVSTEVGQKKTSQQMLYLDINYLFSSSLEYKLKSHFRHTEIGKGDVLLALESTNSRTSIQAESYSLIFDNQIIYRASNNLRVLGGIFTEFTQQSPIAAGSVQDASVDFADLPYIFASEAEKENWNNYALYAQTEWNPSKKLRTTFGMRYINSTKQYDAEILPRVGAVYTLPQGVNVKFNYQRGYRPPSIGETGNTASFYFRNEDIKSETIDTLEIGLFSEAPDHNSLYANFYYSKLKDIIVRENLTLASDPLVTVWDVNGDSITVIGGEIGGKLYIGKKLILSSDLSHTHSTTKKQLSLNKIVTPIKLNFSIDAKPVNHLNVVIDTYIRIDPTTASDNTLYQGQPAPNWYLMNLNVIYDQAFGVKNLTSSLLIKNVLNDSYGLVERRSSHIRYPDYHPQPLRSAMISLRYAL